MFKVMANTNEQTNTANTQTNNEIKPLFEDMNNHNTPNFDTSSIEKMRQAYYGSKPQQVHKQN